MWTLLKFPPPHRQQHHHLVTWSTSSGCELCSSKRATALRVGPWKLLLSSNTLLLLLSMLLPMSLLITGEATAVRRKLARGGATCSFSLPLESADARRKPARGGATDSMPSCSWPCPPAWFGLIRIRIRGFWSLSRSLQRNQQTQLHAAVQRTCLIQPGR